jgi:hypothetical protein
MLADELKKIALANKAEILRSKSEFLAKQIIEIAKTKTAQGETNLEIGSSVWKFSLEEASATAALLKKDGFNSHIVANRIMSGGSFYDHQYEHVIQVSWA